MDPSLFGNFICFPTAKVVWDSIATTFFNGSDTSQVYDLRRRVTRLKQASSSLEKYYTDLQGLWREIDFRRPNPMECSVDIQHYNKITQEDRVYVFLDGLDDRLDKIPADVLQIKPFPSVEQEYAHVRREAIRQQVMTSHNTDGIPGAVLASKGLMLINSTLNKTTKTRTTNDARKCSHCGNQKHIRENCFQLHGYPDWWHDLQARKRRNGACTTGSPSKVAVVVATEPHLSVIQPVPTSTKALPHLNSGNSGLALLTSHSDAACNTWLLDPGATDHMTFDASYFSYISSPCRTSIANANGGVSPVTGAGSVTLSSSLHLTNTLLVPSLSHKLMSVGQLTTDLRCVVLMYSNFYFIQDILTKEIIGRGTKRGDYIMWTALISTRHITCTICILLKRDRSGYSIVA